MKSVYGATWVVLKLRCAPALCMLLLSNTHHRNKRGGLTSFLQPQERLLFPNHVQQPSSLLMLRPFLTTPTPSSSLMPTAGTGIATTSSTRLWQSGNEEEEDQQQKGGRLQRLAQLGVVKKVGGLFLQGGRSLRDFVMFNTKSNVTEMEGAVVQSPTTTLGSNATTNSNEEDGTWTVSDLKGAENTTTTDTDCDSSDHDSGMESTTTTSSSSTTDSTMDLLPKGPRWAIAHPETDLSGTWRPLVTKEFQQEYDTYLQNCGTSYMFRQVVLNFASTTRETITQVDQGRVLHFYGTAPGGNGWKRSLISSGADADDESSDESYEPIHAEFLDPDKELVKVEAWWEDCGRVHKSFLRNKPKVRGGEFESKRYLITDEVTGEKQLVCESIFHPSQKHLDNPSSEFKPAFVRWKYQRES